MGLFDKLNVKKQMDDAMARAAEQNERLNNLDPLDREAQQAELDRSNASINSKMPGFAKRMMPAGMSEKVAKMQQDALDRQAEMYRRMKEDK